MDTSCLQLAVLKSDELARKTVVSIERHSGEGDVAVQFLDNAGQVGPEQIFVRTAKIPSRQEMPGIRLLNGQFILTSSLVAGLCQLKTQKVILVDEESKLRDITQLTQQLEVEFFGPVRRMIEGQYTEGKLWGVPDANPSLCSIRQAV